MSHKQINVVILNSGPQQSFTASCVPHRQAKLALQKELQAGDILAGNNWAETTALAKPGEAVSARAQ